MYKNTFTHYLAKILVDIMFYLGIPCVATAFWWTKLFRPFFYIRGQLDEWYFTLFIAAVISSGLCALYIVWQLKKMFATIALGNPFVVANITCLRKCAVASFLLSIIFLAFFLAIIFFTSETLLVIITVGLLVIIFGILGLFCLTLKDLFKQAVSYKQENDWTV